jgi:hypothetical protein
LQAAARVRQLEDVAEFGAARAELEHRALYLPRRTRGRSSWLATRWEPVRDARLVCDQGPHLLDLVLVGETELLDDNETDLSVDLFRPAKPILRIITA